MWNVFVSGENFLAKISKEFKETINWQMVVFFEVFGNFGIGTLGIFC